MLPLRARLLVPSLVALLPLAACSSDDPEDPDKTPKSDPAAIQLAHPFSAESLPGRAAEAFASLVEEKSDGALEVEVEAEAETGVGDELTSTLEGGTDAALVSTTTTGLDPKLRLQSLPFLATSPEEADELFYGKGAIAEYEAAAFGKHGVHAVYQFESGFRGLSANDAVRLPKDLDGLSLRISPTPWLLAAFKGWGATVEGMPADEVKGALEDGKIDGQESGIRFFVSAGLAEVQDSFTELRHGYATYTLLMGDAAWEELSGEEQDIVVEAAREASETNREDVRAADARALESLGDEVEVIEPTEDEYGAWRAGVADVYAKYQRLFGKKIIKAVTPTGGS